MSDTLVTMPHTVAHVTVELLYCRHNKQFSTVGNLVLREAIWESIDINLSSRAHLTRVEFTLRAAELEGRPRDEFVTLMGQEVEMLKLRFPRLIEKSRLSFSVVFGP